MRREPKNNTANHDGADPGNIRRAEEMARNAPYKWLSEVEEKLLFVFVDDALLLQRARIRIAVRGTPAKPVKITMPKNRKGQLNVANLGDSVFHLARVADRELDADEEQAAQEKFTYWKSNRDELSHRMGRESATIRWKGCTSDAYTFGVNAYQARLAVAGRHLSALGSIQEPSNHKWMPRIAQGSLSAKDMDERQAQADRLALEMVG